MGSKERSRGSEASEVKPTSEQEQNFQHQPVPSCCSSGTAARSPSGAAPALQLLSLHRAACRGASCGQRCQMWTLLHVEVLSICLKPRCKLRCCFTHSNTTAPQTAGLQPQRPLWEPYVTQEPWKGWIICAGWCSSVPLKKKGATLCRSDSGQANKNKADLMKDQKTDPWAATLQTDRQTLA